MALRHRFGLSDYARRPNTSEPYICLTQFVPTHALLVMHFRVIILSWRYVPVLCGLHIQLCMQLRLCNMHSLDTGCGQTVLAQLHVSLLLRALCTSCCISGSKVAEQH